MDREKVIKGLEMCIKDIECTGCPYESECFYTDDDRQFGESMMRDALFLLKEQEEVVHCKDCRYACACYNDMAVCTHVDSNGNDTHSENWFCGDGKRRET